MKRNRFSTLYMKDDMRAMGHLFEKSNIYAKEEFGVEIDRGLFAERFLNSETRELMEDGHPRLESQASQDTFDWYVEEEKLDMQTFVTGKEDDFHDLEMFWIGQMYSYLLFKTQLSSKEIYKIISFEDMRHYYICGHEMSYQGIYEKLQDLFE